MTEPNRSPTEIKGEVRAYWNDRAETYDDDSQHALKNEAQHDAWLSVLHTWTGDAPQRILDVGCGTGVISSLLADLGHDVSGVDYSTEMLDRAREKAREKGHSIDFDVGDAEALDDLDDAYDTVTARHLIWTLPDPAAAIGEWRRVVRPGGRIVLIEGHWDFSGPFAGYERVHDDLPLYDGRSPEELSEFLRAEGLENVSHEPLMAEVLWGETPEYEQYVIAGDVP
ncbi:class I SAM-dependent methyltransferase [Halococcus sp. IIIV-5B]|uniref:class I SAM-dependent methyltransferase n=1 Tax=Halococcus sp. IIIV-5B TaxID=2321230 RepID=UPI000E76B0EF|nr:class I SAM-dependent methyltransferase [Halococcus sp. IIIV-5B]RJT07851.1 class I SAM-dependent methyltransferase [Halococcus sp. IIIV-5B]